MKHIHWRTLWLSLLLVSGMLLSLLTPHLPDDPGGGHPRGRRAGP